MPPRCLRLCLAVLVLVAGVGRLSAQQPAPNEGRPQSGPRLKIERDLEYAAPDGVSLKLDVYRQDPSEKAMPLIVWIHGTRGGDATRATSPAVALVTPGYAVASLDYRAGPNVPLATSIDDVRAAVRWLRANATRFNIDPAHVGAFGHDTGATIAALLGTAEPEVLHRWFDALADGGTVVDPLGPKPWGASDGQVIDRFGLHWLIGYEGQQ